MIHKPIAISNIILSKDVVWLLKKLDRIFPEKAANEEIKNVITEIHRFFRVEIFIPRMLYAILTLMLSRLLASEMNIV
jgi:hypothetical protein